MNTESVMAKTIARRDILKMSAAATLCAAAGVLAKSSTAEAGDTKSLLRAGIITDMHKTSKADSSTRIYSASMDKMKVFIDAMKKEKPAFIIELGDFVDTLAPGTDPAANLRDIEALFTSFAGPAYHVLGNHDFDNLKREAFLSGVVNTGIEKGRTYYSFEAEGVHCIETSPYSDYAKLTYPIKGEYLISKRRYSAFFATDLEILLKGLKVDTLYMIGGLTEVCIHYTAVDAHQHDYRIRVVTDAVAGSSVEAHRYALKAIHYLQRDALVTTADIES